MIMNVLAFINFIVNIEKPSFRAFMFISQDFSIFAFARR